MVMIFHGDSSDGIPVCKKSQKTHKKYKKIQITLDPIQVHGMDKYNVPICSVELEYWLVVSTPLKNISQSGNLPNRGENTKYLKAPPRISFLQSSKNKHTKKRRTPAGNHAVPAEMDLIQDLCSKNKLSCLYRLDRVLGSTRMSCWKLGPMLRIKL